MWYVRFDYNNTIGGGKPCFSDTVKDFDEKMLPWQTYVADNVTDDDADDEDDDGPIKATVHNPTMKLAIGRHGFPLIPKYAIHPKSEGDRRSHLKRQKGIVRALVKGAYSKCS